MDEKFYEDYREKGVTKEMVDTLFLRMKRLFSDALSAAEQGQPYAMAARIGEASYTLDQLQMFYDMLHK